MFYNGYGYAVVLMPYSHCCVSVGGDLAQKFILTTELKKRKREGENFLEYPIK